MKDHQKLSMPWHAYYFIMKNIARIANWLPWPPWTPWLRWPPWPLWPPLPTCPPRPPWQTWPPESPWPLWPPWPWRPWWTWGSWRLNKEIEGCTHTSWRLSDLLNNLQHACVKEVGGYLTRCLHIAASITLNDELWITYSLSQSHM